MEISELLGKFSAFVWGVPLMVVLVGTGLYLTSCLKGIQLRGFSHALKVLRGQYDNPDDPGEISHFRALTTALSATIGTGNIVWGGRRDFNGRSRRCFLDVGHGFGGNGDKICELYFSCSLSPYR